MLSAYAANLARFKRGLSIFSFAVKSSEKVAIVSLLSDWFSQYP